MQLSSFLEDISIVLEIWEIFYLANPNTSHFIYLLNDGTFLCTCMINKTHGYLCRHYYRIMTLTPTARFHIGLINRRWYKDTLQETDISNNTFVVVSSLSISTLKANSLPTRFLSSLNGFDVGLTIVDGNEISKSISKKRKFGELWDLGRKVMVDAIEDDNEDNYHELLEIFLSLQKKSQQRIIDNSNNGNSNNSDINHDGNIDIMNVRNPVERRSKGRPKSKRVKSSLEQPNVKTQYKCKLYKQRGHNSKTCEQKQLNTNANKENIDDER
jgi:hypothetical protein